MRKTWWMCRDAMKFHNDVWSTRREARVMEGCDNNLCGDRSECRGPVALRVVGSKGKKGGA